MSQYEVTGDLVDASAIDLTSAAASLSAERAARRVWSLRATLVAIAAVVGIGIVAGAAWPLSSSVVPWDSKNHFYAMFRFLADAMARREIPLWNPYHFGGHPTVADPQSLLFIPSMVLFGLIAPKASMAVFDAVVFAHLVIGSLGVLGLFRRRNWHPAGAVLAAAIFMLGGSAASRLQHTGMILSYAYLPLALWALEAALERVSLRLGLVFAVTAALMAIGRDQVAFLSCLLLASVVLWQAGASGAPARYLVRRLPLLALIAIVGLALLAIPSLLTLQFLGSSNRPGIAYGVAAAGSLAPVNLATMLAPNVFGSLGWDYHYWGPGYETMSDADWTDRAINYLFAGTLPALLLVWHGMAGGRLLGRGLRFFLCVGAAATLFAVGRATPVFGWIFDLVPGVALYRRPADATFLMNFAFAIAAGYLLHRYVAEGLPNAFRSLKRPVATLLTAAAVGLTAVIVGSALAFSADNSAFWPALRALVLAAAFAGLAAAALFWGRAPGRRAAVAMSLVGLTACELVWNNAAASINAEPAASYAVYNGLSDADAAGLAKLKRELAERHEQGEFPRVEVLGLGGAWQNAAMVEGLEDTLGYNPLRIDDYERAVGPGENAVDPNLRHYPGTFRGYRCTLASLLGLQYLVLDRPLAKLPRHVPRPAATAIYSGEHMFIYRLGKVAPRAYFASAAKPADLADVLDEQHALPAFDRGREVLIDAASMPDLQQRYAADAPTADAHVTIAARHDNSVVLSVDTDRPGIVVLHDLYYPGWVAKVDGVVKPVLRANILFRGVEVPAGHHVVTFAFRPFSVANLQAALAGLRHGED